jgi:hypothetical protein
MSLPPRGMLQQLPALGLLVPTFVPAACEQGECGFVPHASQPQHPTVMVRGWIIQAIGIGHQGPKKRPACEPLVSVGVGACQSAPLPPQQHPAVVSADRGQSALEAQAWGPALATLALSLIPDHAPLREPAIGDGALP